MSPSNRSSIKVAGLYAVVSALWILYSDKIVSELFKDPGLITQVQTFKGGAFVIVTALLLYVLIKKNYKAIERAFELDGLTGLLNHNMFKSQLERRLASLAPGKKLVISFLDVDSFREVNQTLGFENADRFLLQLAQEIKAFALPNAIIARLPPDKFVSANEFDPDVDIDLRVRGFQALFGQVAQRMGISATCSIGVAIYPDDGDTAKKIMVAAVAALEDARRQGNTVFYHDKALSDVAAKRRQMLVDLRTALDNRSLSLVYQPKYLIASGAPCGIEVLIRWHHPIQGFIGPDEFIPLAEEAGLSLAITQFVIATAADELEASGLLGAPIQHVAINISATEFNHPEQIDEILRRLKSHPALARHIRIEITETAMLLDMQRSSAIIAKLHDEGLTLSIDDFGTGYTSLAMLKDLTVDEIKIDRSFVIDMGKGRRSRTIVEAIIAMAKSFNINAVAEGVETQAQLDDLRALGCNEAQGYLLGKPMDISSLVSHLSAQTNY